jgi:hypothetical protein
MASYALERSNRLLFMRERELNLERAQSDALQLHPKRRFLYPVSG